MPPITLQWPAMLLLLTLLPPVGYLLYWARKQRYRASQQLNPQQPLFSSWRQDSLSLLILTLLILALARPGYQPQARNTEESSRDLVFVVDVSRSMLAQDASPSRLSVAKQAILDCLETLEQQRTALVIYGGTASILSPLSRDHNFVRYMLEKTEPYSVAYGGSLLLSAMQKTIDEVLPVQRQGYQDIILLTDGDDQSGELHHVAQLLNQAQAHLLIIGIGDPHQGSPIPVTDEAGQSVPLKYEDEIVLTQLEQSNIEHFSQQVQHCQTHIVGTQPFHLGDIYQAYSQKLPLPPSSDSETELIYQEAAFPLLLLALLLLCLQQWSRLRQRFLLTLITATTLNGQDIPAAWQAHQQEDYPQAIEHYQSIIQQNDNPSLIAHAAYNQGLCQLLLLQQQLDTSPAEQLTQAQKAQQAFLLASRQGIKLPLAGQKLQHIALTIEQLQTQISQQEQEQTELLSSLQPLLDEIAQLLQKQKALSRQLQPFQKTRKRNNAQSKVWKPQFRQTQEQLVVTAQDIYPRMQAIAQALQALNTGDLPDDAFITILDIPLVLMGKAIHAMQTAQQHLLQAKLATLAQRQQNTAAQYLQEILDQFADQQNQDGDIGSEEDDQDYEDYEDYEYEDSDQDSQMNNAWQESQQSQTQWQEAPPPNLNPQDIISEESANAQFRQQQSQGKAGSVKKDW